MRLAAGLLLLSLLSAAPAPAGQGGHGGDVAAAGRPQLYENLGDHHRPISTASPAAQRWFDQGLRWMFDFNLEEAQRSFAEAARLDPGCASCFWGEALALGPHLNLGALPERTVAGARAAARARAAAAAAPPTPVERALVEAIQRRYADPAPTAPAAQRALDQAYADAMRAVARQFPGDADVLVLTADALLDLWPWDLWGADGAPRPDTLEIVALLERALALDPRHPWANHLYIHATEASPQPEKGLVAADRLGALAPGAPHLVHMPAHTYLRLGRYADAAAANERAILAEDAYVARARPQGFYLMYVAHNHQFLWATAMMEGRRSVALREARTMLDALPAATLRAMPGLDFVLAYPHWTHVRFGRWAELRLEPLPPVEWPYAHGVATIARGVGEVETGRSDEAERDLALARADFAKLPPDAVEALNPAATLAQVGLELLAGELALARERREEGLAHLRAAVAAEDALRYDEPADWYLPVRPWLGAALLAAGDPAAAQQVYEEDLARHPENGWSLAGLADSLARQGRLADAGAARERLGRAWARADVAVPAFTPRAAAAGATP